MDMDTDVSGGTRPECSRDQRWRHLSAIAVRLRDHHGLEARAAKGSLLPDPQLLIFAGSDRPATPIVFACQSGPDQQLMVVDAGGHPLPSSQLPDVADHLAQLVESMSTRGPG
ncbi:hypothetical protein [Actinomadura kijaniata]|uniref:hypothetical protein n=1 Tax=Actinomadura kijaniata TaxID=46161 RepID=UPI000829FD43|nr:hypothetical protein [Actinomadura kijaniata]